MHLTTKVGLGITAAGMLFWGLTGTAFADGYGDSTAAAPADEGRKFGWSITLGGTSDYIFRGISQTDGDPAAQGSVDMTYGIFYAGVWGSNIDFADGGSAEIDVYAGFKPVWGPLTFDFGVLYYAYPDQSGPLAVDYWELKAGVSGSPFTNLTLSTVFYWSPDYSFETGNVYTYEGTAAYTLPAVRIFTPTISGTLGLWDPEEFGAVVVGGDDVLYWNAGLALAVEKFTFDFRYWDTDFNSDITDARFVFTAKVTLP